MIDNDIFESIFVIAFFFIFFMICCSICSALCRRNAMYRSQSTANIISTEAQRSSSIQNIGAVSSLMIPPVSSQICPPYPANSVLITTSYPENPPPVNPYMAAALNSQNLYQDALPPPYSDVAPYPSNPTGQAPYPSNPTGQAPYPSNPTGQAPYPSNPTGCPPYPVNVSQYPANQPFVSTTWSQSNPPYPVNPQMPYDISQAIASSRRFE